MKIKDYIFYRMYCIYKKSNDFGRLTAILYLTLIDFFLFAPFILLALIAFRAKGIYTYLLIFIPMGIIFSFNYKRYIKKDRLNLLIKTYNKNKYNKTVKNWMLYALIFVAIAWGLLGIVPIGNLIMWLFK